MNGYEFVLSEDSMRNFPISIFRHCVRVGDFVDFRVASFPLPNFPFGSARQIRRFSVGMRSTVSRASFQCVVLPYSISTMGAYVANTTIGAAAFFVESVIFRILREMRSICPMWRCALSGTRIATPTWYMSLLSAAPFVFFLMLRLRGTHFPHMIGYAGYVFLVWLRYVSGVCGVRALWRLSFRRI